MEKKDQMLEYMQDIVSIKKVEDTKNARVVGVQGKAKGNKSKNGGNRYQKGGIQRKHIGS